MSALSYPEAISYIWKTDGEGFILMREDEVAGRAIRSSSGLDLTLDDTDIRLFRRGFIRPRLCIQDGGGNVIGKVVGLSEFEPRIEMWNGNCYVHRPIKEGLMNYAISDCSGGLVMEVLDKSTWESPCLTINLYRTGMDDVEAALLASVSLFMYLDRRQGPKRAGGGI